ncbi:hypothetical protein [Evansella clarkii]|nr:hypothetical protein [Evansella clarkii]
MNDKESSIDIKKKRGMSVLCWMVKMGTTLLSISVLFYLIQNDFLMDSDF